MIAKKRNWSRVINEANFFWYFIFLYKFVNASVTLFSLLTMLSLYSVYCLMSYHCIVQVAMKTAQSVNL